MRLLSLDHLTLFELTPPELVATAAEAGFDHVGFRLNPVAVGEKQHPMIGDTPMRRETIARMRDGGVSLWDFGVVKLVPDTVVAGFEAVLDAGAALGARHVVVNGYDEDFPRLADHLAAVCEFGGRHGLTMNLEFLPWSAVRNIADAVRVVQACGHPRARVMIDTLHVDRSLGTPADIAAVPPALIAYAQICDGHGPRPSDVETMLYQARNERGFPGEGNLDLVGMVRALPAGIPLSLETPTKSLEATLSPVQRARRGREALLALLATVDGRKG